MSNLQQINKEEIKVKSQQNQTINVNSQKKSFLDGANEKKEIIGSLNVMTGQIVRKEDDYNTIEDNFHKINKLNEEQNMNDFISEFENEDENKNTLYNSSNSRIVKFFDYSTKFGLVYLISSEYNYIGICFNDFSTLIQNANLSAVDSKNKLIYNYFDKDHKNLVNFDELGLDSCIKSKQSNKDLAKKCEIMRQIVNKYSQEVANLKPLYDNNDMSNYNLNKIVILKDFLKVQQATLLRLSNKLVQIVFSDQTEIMLSTEATDVIFRNKNGEEVFDSIQSIMASDSVEIIKRIKFSKNLMIHFVKTFKSLSTANTQKKK